MPKTDDYRDPKPTPQFYWQTTRPEPTPAQLHEHARTHAKTEAATNDNKDSNNNNDSLSPYAPYPHEFPAIVFKAIQPFPDAFKAIAYAMKEFYQRREKLAG